MPEHPSLLRTKLYAPAFRSELVERKRLLNELNANLTGRAGFNRNLTLIAAPAGYGKTTLTCQWIETVEIPVAWLSLEEDDNDPTRFIHYLLAALQTVDPDLGSEALAMLEAPQRPPDDVLITALINDLSSHPEKLILVLDDYHVIQIPTIHKQLTSILDHQPANLHLVITSREDPLIPIPRLRARGQVLEIRQDDLRFTTAETAEFLERVMGLSISPGEVAALERRTEGWIAGLQLAALSMRGRDDLSGFIQVFTGSSRFILDFLIEEVFDRQPPEVKDFLLKTSILERLSGRLCDVVVERTLCQELLETLEQANLFIVPLDQSRLWYRYHRLFAELLRHRLRASHPKLETELHQRASEWFETEGLIPEAIQHALAAQDWARAEGLIRSITTDYLKRGEVLTVIGWFESFPEEILLSNPKLCFEYCWPLLLAGQFDKAAPLLERVEQVAKDLPTFLGEIYAAQAYLARGVGDHERMVERSQHALELLPKSSIVPRGIVTLNLGLAYWHMGQMGKAEAALAEALEVAQATDNQYAALTALIFLGRVFAVRGQLHRAERSSKDAIRQGGEMPVNALAHMDLAALHYEWNMLDVSEENLEKAISLCQQSQNYEFLVGCLLLGSRIRAAQGEIVAAEEALDQAWTLVREGKIPEPMVERVNVAQAYLLLEKGEPAGEWGQKLTEKVDCHTFYRFLGVTKARTLPDAHARTYLEGLGEVALANEWSYGFVAVRALQASLAETQEDGLEYLIEALQMGEGGGFIRSFVEAGKKLIPMLRQAGKQGVLPEYVGRILAVMTGKAGTVRPGLALMIEPLSERELEVLRLVAAGLSNREIAEKLVISTGTAKTHVHNLCGKLGVHNRTEAAMKAKELDLV